MQFHCIPEKVFLRVGIFGKVEPASRWVSLVKCKEMLLVLSICCGKVELEDFVWEIAEYGLGDLYPWPLNGDEGAVDPPPPSL